MPFKTNSPAATLTVETPDAILGVRFIIIVFAIVTDMNDRK